MAKKGYLPACFSLSQTRIDEVLVAHIESSKGNPSSDVIDISSYSASGLAPSNAIQQQISNIADAKSNDVTQTMEFVSQGKILDSFISFCYIKHINMHNNMKQSHFSDAGKSFSLQ